MSKKKNETAPEEEIAQETVEEEVKAEAPVEAAPASDDRYIRLMAEYDNFRKRSAKERENIYTDVRVDTVSKFLPVYDNLARAMGTATTDEAYKKGVEMTFNQLCEVFKKLGVEEIEAVGKTFDPNFHNAVMHVDDEAVEENTVVDVFQQGFKCGEKVIRFAMVKVAN